MKKWLGFLLSFALTIGSVGLTSSPASAAQICTGFAAGMGSSAAPYEVANLDDWQLFQACVLSADFGARYIYFKQTGDFSVATLGNAGGAGGFGGNYDGNNHTITGIALTNASGLFQQLQIGSISNLNIEGFVTNSSRVGGLVGYVFDGGSVSNVHSRVTVSSPASALGGLVGGMSGGSISNSSASPAIGQIDLVVSSFHSNTVDGIGGLVGDTFNANIYNSYSTGRVNVGDSPTNSVGGLVGSFHSQSRQISSSYSDSEVYAPNSTYVGGLVGSLNGGSSIRNSYATGNVTGLTILGGFVGRTISGTTVEKSYSRGLVTALAVDAVVGGFIATSTGATTLYSGTYWDNTSPNHPTSFGQSTGLSGSQWSSPNTFAGWSISDAGTSDYTWKICPGQLNGKPLLGWQVTDCVYPPSAPQLALTSVTDGTVSLRIQPPSFLGNAAITGYFIETSADNVTWVTDENPSTDLTRSITGLTNGQPNYFRVLAKNINFTSPASNTVTAVSWELPSGNDHAFQRLAVNETLGNSAKGFIQFGEKIYFQASDGVHGAELWSWDEVGTPTLVADISAGQGGSYVGDFIVGGDYLFFKADNGSGQAIYKFDGLNPPVRMALTNTPTIYIDNELHLTFLTEKLYFSAFDTNEQAKYYSLRPSETVAIPVGCVGAGNDFPAREPVLLNSKIYFTGIDNLGGLALFVNDGTSCAKVPGFTQVSNLTLRDSKIYFSAASPDGSEEMWIYDGTNALMIDIDHDSSNSSSPQFSSSTSPTREVQMLGGKIIFSANTLARGRELMTLDSDNVVAPLPDFYPGSISGVATMGSTFEGNYYFACVDVALSFEICRLDSNGRMTLFQDLTPGPEASSPSSFLATQKHLLLATSSSQPPSEGYFLSTQSAHDLEFPSAGAISANTLSVAPIFPKFNNLTGMKINAASGVMKLSGSGFAGIIAMKIGGRVVKITKTGDSEIEITYDQLTPGLNDLVLETEKGLVILQDAVFVSKAAVKRPAAKSVVCLAGHTSYFSKEAAIARASLLCRRLKEAKPNLIMKVAVRKWPKATLRAVYDTTR